MYSYLLLDVIIGDLLSGDSWKEALNEVTSVVCIVFLVLLLHKAPFFNLVKN